MPSVATAAVNAAEDAPGTLDKQRATKRADITANEIETAKNWWYFNKGVPLRIRRILDAMEV